MICQHPSWEIQKLSQTILNITSDALPLVILQVWHLVPPSISQPCRCLPFKTKETLTILSRHKMSMMIDRAIDHAHVFSRFLQFCLSDAVGKAGVSAAAPADSSLSSAARPLIPLIYSPRRIYNKIMTRQFLSKEHVFIVFHFCPSLLFTSLAQSLFNCPSQTTSRSGVPKTYQTYLVLTYRSELQKALSSSFQSAICMPFGYRVSGEAWAAFRECRVEFGVQWRLELSYQNREPKKQVLASLLMLPFSRSLNQIVCDISVWRREEVRWKDRERGVYDLEVFPFTCTIKIICFNNGVVGGDIEV